MASKVDSKSLITSGIPHVYITGVDIGKTVCTLNLAAKEISSVGSAKNSWSSNDKLSNKLKIRVIRSLSAEATNDLNNQVNYVEVVSRAERLGLYQDDYIIPRKEILNKNKSFYQTEDKATVENFQFRYVDTGLPENIDHLTYFVLMYVDFAGDGLDLNPHTSQDLVGRVTVENVINQGSPPSKGTIFYIRDTGKVWGGEIHKMKDGTFHSGPKHTKDSVVLVPRSVANTKVKDLREIEKIKKVKLDFSKPQKNKFSKKTAEPDNEQGATTPPPERVRRTAQPNVNILSAEDLDVTQEDAFFTHLMTSNDSEDNTRFLFGINYSHILAEKTKFGKMYHALSKANPSIRAAVAKYVVKSEINRITIKRRRVENSSELNRIDTPVFSKVSFDKDNAIDEVIMESSPGRTSDIPPDPDEISSGFLSEISLYTGQADRDNYKYFTGRDVSIRNKTYGLYRYGVNVEIIDRSAEFVHNLINQLKSARNVLLEHRNEGSKLGNYVPETDRFTESFIEERENNSLQWKTALEDMSNVLYLISLLGDKPTIPNRTRLALTPFVLSATANPDSVQTVIALIDSKISELIDLVGGAAGSTGTNRLDPSVAARDYTTGTKTSRSAPASIKNIVMEHFFDHVVDADFERGVGYDYLTEDLNHNSDSNGLFVIGSQEMIRRVEEETLKYYKSTDVDISMVVKGENYTTGDSLRRNDLRYLSPLVARVMNVNHLLVNKIDVDNFQDLDAEKDILFYNLHKEKFGISPARIGTTQQHNNRRDEALSEALGIFIASPDAVENNKDFFNINSDSTDKPIIAPSIRDKTFGKDAFSEEEKFVPLVLSGLLRSGLVSEPTKADFVEVCTRKIDSYNTLVSCNDIFFNPNKKRPDAPQHSRAISHRQKRSETLAGLPNQIKSVILGNISADTVNINWFDVKSARPTEDNFLGATYRLNYEQLQEVEVLTSYQKTATNGATAKSPIFTPMSRKILGFIPPGQRVLCRLKKYRNEKFGMTGKTNNLSLPIYNEYFILTNDTPQPPPAQPKTVAALDAPPSDLNQYMHTKIYFPKEKKKTMVFRTALTQAKTKVANQKKKRIQKSSKPPAPAPKSPPPEPAEPRVAGQMTTTPRAPGANRGPGRGDTSQGGGY